ncbi:hypothetical protein LAS9267_00225 [Latilactobacillus sakei]|uniref:Uncharacterized protein n=1 Tax=Latilactobacillus sakei TaxID=1599 RepID=A0AAE8J3H3_LATSK|nr:hypothetical protein LAS9267_00225 [Latilactobacillus sakei]
MNHRQRAIKQSMYRDKYPYYRRVEFGLNMAKVLRYMKRPKRANQISWHKSNKGW